MSYFDPLEQFSVELFNCTYSFPNITSMELMLSLNLILCTFFISILNINNITYRQSKYKKLLFILFFFISDLIKTSVSSKKNSFTLIIFFLFIFLCISNVIGMVPCVLTVTSHLSVTLFFSLSFFITHNLIGLCYHKEVFFSLFLPSGVPIFIIPLLILIEYVSYLSRILSLSIRLFANMVSGHILLKILVGFV
jgi:F-type H+-transporting ATPase subunit a